MFTLEQVLNTQRANMLNVGERGKDSEKESVPENFRFISEQFSYDILYHKLYNL